MTRCSCRAGRRNRELGGLLVHQESQEELPAWANLGAPLLDVWLPWEAFQGCPEESLGTDPDLIICSAGFQQRSGLTPDEDNTVPS